MLHTTCLQGNGRRNHNETHWDGHGQKDSKRWRECGEARASDAAAIATAETAGQLLQSLDMQLPYNPTIPLLGIYIPKRSENAYAHKTWTQMLIAALFIIAPKVETTYMSIN